MSAGLIRAAHPGPTATVVLLAVLLGVSFGVTAPLLVLLAAAVLAGQVSVGWGNDLLDESRDRAVGRTSKPLVGGAVSTGTVRAACGTALVLVVPLSLACGWLAGLVHLLAVASAWAYNLGLKATWWSWLPYAVSFGGLVLFVWLVSPATGTAPWSLVAAGSLLGVGAHLANVLPDLADDERTGVRGLPHRIGPRWLPAAAAAVLASGSVVMLAGLPDAWTGVLRWSSVALVAALVLLAVVGRGRTPFLAAIGIAVVDVVLLVAAR